MTHTEILEKVGTAVKKGLGIDESVLESLEEALLAADVGAETAAALTEAVRERASGSPSARTSRSSGRCFCRGDREAPRVGARAPRAEPTSPLFVTFLVGVNGSGKTTTTAKLARPARRPPAAASCSPPPTRSARERSSSSRPGPTASSCPIVRHREGADPSAVLFDALSAAKARGVRTLLVDTAGRLHTKKNLMDELAKMRRIAAREVEGAPHETLLVLDATTGTNGLAQARRFVEAAGATGVVLTKLDGSARGGIVLAIYRELKLPVLFVGVGETVDDLVPFDPAEYAKALLEDDAAH